MFVILKLKNKMIQFQMLIKAKNKREALDKAIEEFRKHSTKKMRKKLRVGYCKKQSRNNYKCYGFERY